MNHFSTETLIDFARGLLPSQKADEVRHHLEGCKKSRQSYDVWRALVEAGRREKKYRPSESAVQRAKEAFGGRGVWRPGGRKTRSRLIFDSFLQPLPEGVRNSMAATRQLQYRSGPLLIDIELAKESHGAEGPVLLMGLILNAENPDQRVKDSRVVLVRGERVRAQTMFFEIEGQEVIPVSLPELASWPSKASR